MKFEVFREESLKRLMRLDAPGSALRVAICLLGHINRTDWHETGDVNVWPSLDRIAHQTNLTRSAVNRALKWLKGVGFYTNVGDGIRTITSEFLDPLPSGDQNGTGAGRPKWH